MNYGYYISKYQIVGTFGGVLIWWISGGGLKYYIVNL